MTQARPNGTIQPSARPTRRDSYVILLSVAIVCALAPEVVFLFVGLTTLVLPRLPRAVRVAAVAISLVVCALGIVKITVNSY